MSDSWTMYKAWSLYFGETGTFSPRDELKRTLQETLCKYLFYSSEVDLFWNGIAVFQYVLTVEQTAIIFQQDNENS